MTELSEFLSVIDGSKYRFQNSAGQSPSYLIRDGGFLGPTAYDDTSLTYDNDIDGKTQVTTRISTVIMSLFDKFPGHGKREIPRPVHEVLRLRQRDRLSVLVSVPACGRHRIEEMELSNALHPNHVTACFHTVHRHKPCYEYRCYSCCQAMPCYSMTHAVHCRA